MARYGKSNAQKARLFAQQKGRCCYCKRQMTLTLVESDPDAHATWDHKRPRLHGGSDKPANLVLACSLCNRKKGNISYSDWIEQRGWLLNNTELKRLKAALKPTWFPS